MTPPTMRRSDASHSCGSTVSLSDSSSSSSPSIISEEVLIKETRRESYLYPKFGTGQLPSQAESTKFLKYLIYVPIISLIVMVAFTEFWMRVGLKYGLVYQIETFFKNTFNDKLAFALICAGSAVGFVSYILSVDVYTLVMLWHGKRRRALPSDPNKRLVHAVVICQYKEPLDVLDATVASLAESTRAHSSIVVLACEARDPFADRVFETLEAKYSHLFRNFLKTDHHLTPGEVVGKSSNENHAVRELYQYTQREGLDPFKVMVTVCDADSLFDPVFLEHTEAEFWRMPDGRRTIYNAPINTYRNLRECNVFVQAVEMSRCQYDTFAGMSFRPSQSNYSLTLGLCHETGYWDPSNTAEDFHTTLKAMAITGQGKPIVVQVWSLILNDSVCSFQDRWTQAKRHMWGIEECAWALSLFFHLRFKRWMAIMGMTFGRMLLEKNCIPPFLIFFLPSVQKVFFSLEATTQHCIVGLYIANRLLLWIQTVLREVALRRYILADRKHMMKAGWVNRLLLATPLYVVVEDLSLLYFFTWATWSMLLHALHHDTIMYVTAPKAFTNNEEEPLSSTDEPRKMV